MCFTSNYVILKFSEAESLFLFLCQSNEHPSSICQWEAEKKRMVCVGGSDLIGTHDRNKQEEISCFLFFIFLCFRSSRFSSRVLDRSENDAISSSKEHVPHQRIICCQLQQKALPQWNHLGPVATAGVCLPHITPLRHSWFLWWHLDTHKKDKFAWKGKREYDQLLLSIPAYKKC